MNFNGRLFTPLVLLLIVMVLLTACGDQSTSTEARLPTSVPVGVEGDEAAGEQESQIANAVVAGEFEFPGGDDVPAVDAESNVVTPPFAIAGGLPVTMPLQLVEREDLDAFLADATDVTVYTLWSPSPNY